MNPKLLEYLDEDQRKQLEQRKGLHRLIGLRAEKIKGFFKKLYWRLWGRRKAIARMRELAGLTGPKPVKQFEAPEKIGYIQKQTRLPAPDSPDVN